MSFLTTLFFLIFPIKLSFSLFTSLLNYSEIVVTPNNYLIFSLLKYSSHITNDFLASFTTESSVCFSLRINSLYLTKDTNHEVTSNPIISLSLDQDNTITITEKQSIYSYYYFLGIYYNNSNEILTLKLNSYDGLYKHMIITINLGLNDITSTVYLLNNGEMKILKTGNVTHNGIISVKEIFKRSSGGNIQIKGNEHKADVSEFIINDIIISNKSDSTDISQALSNEHVNTNYNFTFFINPNIDGNFNRTEVISYSYINKTINDYYDNSYILYFDNGGFELVYYDTEANKYTKKGIFEYDGFDQWTKVTLENRVAEKELNIHLSDRCNTSIQVHQIKNAFIPLLSIEKGEIKYEAIFNKFKQSFIIDVYMNSNNTMFSENCFLPPTTNTNRNNFIPASTVNLLFDERKIKGNGFTFDFWIFIHNDDFRISGLSETSSLILYISSTGMRLEYTHDIIRISTAISITRNEWMYIRVVSSMSYNNQISGNNNIEKSVYSPLNDESYLSRIYAFSTKRKESFITNLRLFDSVISSEIKLKNELNKGEFGSVYYFTVNKAGDFIDKYTNKVYIAYNESNIIYNVEYDFKSIESDLGGNCDVKYDFIYYCNDKNYLELNQGQLYGIEKYTYQGNEGEYFQTDFYFRKSTLWEDPTGKALNNNFQIGVFQYTIENNSILVIYNNLTLMLPLVYNTIYSVLIHYDYYTKSVHYYLNNYVLKTYQLTSLPKKESNYLITISSMPSYAIYLEKIIIYSNPHLIHYMFQEDTCYITNYIPENVKYNLNLLSFTKTDFYGNAINTNPTNYSEVKYLYLQTNGSQLPNLQNHLIKGTSPFSIAFSIKHIGINNKNLFTIGRTNVAGEDNSIKFESDREIIALVPIVINKWYTIIFNFYNDGVTKDYTLIIIINRLRYEHPLDIIEPNNWLGTLVINAPLAISEFTIIDDTFQSIKEFYSRKHVNLIQEYTHVDINSSRESVLCEENEYFNNNKCNQCESNCVNCFSGGKCTQCKNGYFNGQGRCFSQEEKNKCLNENGIYSDLYNNCISWNKENMIVSTAKTRIDVNNNIKNDFTVEFWFIIYKEGDGNNKNSVEILRISPVFQGRFNYTDIMCNGVKTNIETNKWNYVKCSYRNETNITTLNYNKDMRLTNGTKGILGNDIITTLGFEYENTAIKLVIKRLTIYSLFAGFSTQRINRNFIVHSSGYTYAYEQYHYSLPTLNQDFAGEVTFEDNQGVYIEKYQTYSPESNLSIVNHFYSGFVNAYLQCAEGCDRCINSSTCIDHEIKISTINPCDMSMSIGNPISNQCISFTSIIKNIYVNSSPNLLQLNIDYYETHSFMAFGLYSNIIITFTPGSTSGNLETKHGNFNYDYFYTPLSGPSAPNILTFKIEGTSTIQFHYITHRSFLITPTTFIPYIQIIANPNQNTSIITGSDLLFFNKIFNFNRVPVVNPAVVHVSWIVQVSSDSVSYHCGNTRTCTSIVLDKHYSNYPIRIFLSVGFSDGSEYNSVTIASNIRPEEHKNQTGTIRSISDGSDVILFHEMPNYYTPYNKIKVINLKNIYKMIHYNESLSDIFPEGNSQVLAYDYRNSQVIELTANMKYSANINAAYESRNGYVNVVEKMNKGVTGIKRIEYENGNFHLNYNCTAAPFIIHSPMETEITFKLHSNSEYLYYNIFVEDSAGLIYQINSYPLLNTSYTATVLPKIETFFFDVVQGDGLHIKVNCFSGFEYLNSRGIQKMRTDNDYDVIAVFKRLYYYSTFTPGSKQELTLFDNTFQDISNNLVNIPFNIYLFYLRLSINKINVPILPRVISTYLPFFTDYNNTNMLYRYLTQSNSDKLMQQFIYNIGSIVHNSSYPLHFSTPDNSTSLYGYRLDYYSEDHITLDNISINDLGIPLWQYPFNIGDDYGMLIAIEEKHRTVYTFSQYYMYNDNTTMQSKGRISVNIPITWNEGNESKNIGTGTCVIMLNNINTPCDTWFIHRNLVQCICRGSGRISLVNDEVGSTVSKNRQFHRFNIEINIYGVYVASVIIFGGIVIHLGYLYRLKRRNDLPKGDDGYADYIREIKRKRVLYYNSKLNKGIDFICFIITKLNCCQCNRNGFFAYDKHQFTWVYKQIKCVLFILNTILCIEIMFYLVELFDKEINKNYNERPYHTRNITVLYKIVEENLFSRALWFGVISLVFNCLLIRRYEDIWYPDLQQKQRRILKTTGKHILTSYQKSTSFVRNTKQKMFRKVIKCYHCICFINFISGRIGNALQGTTNTKPEENGGVYNGLTIVDHTKRYSKLTLTLGEICFTLDKTTHNTRNREGDLKYSSTPTRAESRSTFTVSYTPYKAKSLSFYFHSRKLFFLTSSALILIVTLLIFIFSCKNIRYYGSFILLVFLYSLVLSLGIYIATHTILGLLLSVILVVKYSVFFRFKNKRITVTSKSKVLKWVLVVSQHTFPEVPYYVAMYHELIMNKDLTQEDESESDLNNY